MTAIATPKFVDTLPGKKPGAKSRFAKHAEILRKNEGRWALVGNYKTANSANSVGYKIRQGALPAFGEGFEATVRGKSLYVRYVGVE